MIASTRPTPRKRALTAAGAAAALTLALAACGSSADSSHDSSMPGMHHGGSASPTTPAGHGSSMSGMPGMGRSVTGDGLTDSVEGYRFTSPDATLKAGRAAPYRFTITGPDGKAVTRFAPEQTKRMHFYAVRSDLTGFQHLHPTMAPDGTWTAEPAALAPGSWRMFASFTPGGGSGEGEDFVLSRTVTVPGEATSAALPPAAHSTRVDGYTVTVSGEPMAGMPHPLAVRITKDGKPVTDLQPYLDTYAHLTAFHRGDAAFAHLHPTTTAHGDHGGPGLSFHADLPTAGDWRLFLQFRTGGKLHTAALTLRVG
ncbi:hypothetical protein [Streptomyces sp. IBSBF 3136]|uniref:hypothetical protein n=1 Tax=Streptomyces sp. IBSBF 3136 TaxID=2903524 RepID=UPI002FDC3365